VRAVRWALRFPAELVFWVVAVSVYLVSVPAHWVWGACVGGWVTGRETVEDYARGRG